MYLIDIKGFLGIEKLTYMADISRFRGHWFFDRGDCYGNMPLW